MQIKQGSIVKSMAGHDSDRFYVVVKLEGDFAYIADGKVDLNETATNNTLKIALSEFNSERPVTKEVI